MSRPDPEIDIVAHVEGFDEPTQPTAAPTAAAPMPGEAAKPARFKSRVAIAPDFFAGYRILAADETLRAGDILRLRNPREEHNYYDAVTLPDGSTGGRMADNDEAAGSLVSSQSSNALYLRPLDPPSPGPLAVRTRVKLAVKTYRDTEINPVWGGAFGHVGGIVLQNDRSVEQPYAVQWDNGKTNAYRLTEIQRLSAEEQAMSADNPLPAPEPAKPEPVSAVSGEWPEAAKRNREAWLTEAARRICLDPTWLQNVLFSVGFGKGGTRGKTMVSIVDNAQGTGKQVFVRPTIEGKREAASALINALGDLGLKWQSHNPDTFPDYPQPDIKSETKKQATNMLKCECEKCGVVFRMTARWIDKAEGHIQCPMPTCSNSRVTITR